MFGTYGRISSSLYHKIFDGANFMLRLGMPVVMLLLLALSLYESSVEACWLLVAITAALPCLYFTLFIPVFIRNIKICGNSKKIKGNLKVVEKDYGKEYEDITKLRRTLEKFAKTNKLSLQTEIHQIGKVCESIFGEFGADVLAEVGLKAFDTKTWLSKVYAFNGSPSKAFKGKYSDERQNRVCHTYDNLIIPLYDKYKEQGYTFDTNIDTTYKLYDCFVEQCRNFAGDVVCREYLTYKFMVKSSDIRVLYSLILRLQIGLYQMSVDKDSNCRFIQYIDLQELGDNKLIQAIIKKYNSEVAMV